MFDLKFDRIFKDIRTGFIKKSPEILIIMGVGGIISTTILGIKATPKAIRLIEEKKKELGVEELTKIDTVKTTWRCYIYTAVSGLATIGCVVGANSIHLRRRVALATAYTISESALKEYRSKVVDTIGEKKEQLVRDAISKEKIENNPVSNNEVIMTRNGDTLCYDPVFEKYFRSDINTIKKAIIEVNMLMINNQYVSVNEFYYELGLKPVSRGEDLGWSIYDGTVDIRFSSHISDDDTPCIVLDYTIAPKYDYYRS